MHQGAQAPFLAVGATLVTGGVLLRLWAISTLGRFFTYQLAIAPDQRVVTEGPYRWVRHPSYTGLLVSCLGAGVSGNVASLVAVLAMSTYGLARRIRVEEQALLDALGEPYRRFLATRKRLVPGIW